MQQFYTDEYTEREAEEEHRAMEIKALKKSHGEFPTFSTHGAKQVTNNGKVL